MLACIACIEDRDLQTTTPKREGKGSHIRCHLGSEDNEGKNQLIEGKNAGVVRRREETQSHGEGLAGSSPVEFPHLGADLRYSRVPSCM